MALSANGLASAISGSITGRINNKNAADMTMRELGHAIAKYLTKETEVKYAWTGQIPGESPTPDPATSYTTKRVTGDFICAPTLTRDPVLHGVKLGKQITDGIRKFQIFPADGWAVPPGQFLCAPAIVLPPYSNSDHYAYWLFQARVILRYYKTWIKSAPLPGTHGPYTGSPGAVMSSIY